MYNCGLALVHGPLNKLSPRVIASLLEAKSCVKQVLYIKFEKSGDHGLTCNEEDNLAYVPNIYRAASSHTPNLDVRVLLKNKLNVFKHKPEILLTNYDKTDSKISKILSELKPIEFKQINCDIGDDENKTIQVSNCPRRHNHTCLGGTFDGIHNGHKVLLSEAIIRTRESLTIGITDVSMIKTKILWELIRHPQERMKLVQDFVIDVFDGINYKIVPISDPFGPAIVDSELSCLIVSDETVKGGVKINEIRQQKGLKPLEVIAIKLVADEHHETELEEEKVASSSFRIRRLGTLLNEPNPYSGKGPYLIGLTGGIASGKSSICKRLEKLGAGIVNADLVAHETYQTPDSPAYSKLLDCFGSSIIDPTTKQVDRKKLGSIVFSDQNKLAQLNSIIWPETAKAVEKRIVSMQHSHKVIVVEAAVLLEASWHKTGGFHQIWVTIIPPEEAVKRLTERNQLSEKDAKKRIDCQLDNWTRVQSSHIVFCTLWDYKFTQVQVEKAWNLLSSFVTR